MKVLIKANTPLGIFSSCVQDLTELEFNKLLDYIQAGLNYISLQDEDGNEVILKKDLILNSAITVIKMKK